MVFYVSRGTVSATAQDIADAINNGTFTGTMAFDGDVRFEQDVQIGTTSADTLTIEATTTFNEDVDILTGSEIGTVNIGTGSADVVVNIGSGTGDTLTVKSTTSFDNDVTIGSSSLDDLTVNAQALFNDDVTIDDAANIILGTTTGTKIGTSTSQKLSFYGKTTQAQLQVSGSRGGNVALQSLLANLDVLGLIDDVTTA